MAEIDFYQKHYIPKQLIVGVTYDPRTETATDADNVIDAAYPPLIGYTRTETTLNEVCSGPLWWVKRALGYVRSVTERLNEDGTITRTYTITQP